MVEEPKPNLPLLRAVLAQIDATPERWNQGYWATKTDCGTAYCIAGWAVHISNPQAQPYWGGTELDNADEACVVLDEEDGERFIDQSARKLLGLTGTESWSLFGGKNTRADVQRIAEQIAARAGESL